MNRFERLVGLSREAKIKFLDGEFQILSPGDYVVCAQSGDPIRIGDLKYWNVERQEAYANAEMALKAHLKAVK